MSLLPSARPPSSQRRSPNIDGAEARAFVERASGNTQTVASADEEGRGVGLTLQPGRSDRGAREQLRPLTLRIPESLHRSLLYIADNGSKSMNQFAIDALTPAAEAQMHRIAKRKELGLD